MNFRAQQLGTTNYRRFIGLWALTLLIASSFQGWLGSSTQAQSETGVTIDSILAGYRNNLDGIVTGTGKMSLTYENSRESAAFKKKEYEVAFTFSGQKLLCAVNSQWIGKDETVNVQPTQKIISDPEKVISHKANDYAYVWPLTGESSVQDTYRFDPRNWGVRQCYAGVSVITPDTFILKARKGSQDPAGGWTSPVMLGSKEIDGVQAEGIQIGVRAGGEGTLISIPCRMWFAPSLGYCPVKIENVWEDGSVISSSKASFKEYKGVWFVDTAEHVSGDERYTVKVTELTLNNPVDESVFQSTSILPQGTEVVDTRGPETLSYVIGQVGNEDTRSPGE